MAFLVTGPRRWDSLPPHVKSASSVDIFKTRFNTFLFSRSFSLKPSRTVFKVGIKSRDISHGRKSTAIRISEGKWMIYKKVNLSKYDNCWLLKLLLFLFELFVFLWVSSLLFVWSRWFRTQSLKLNLKQRQNWLLIRVYWRTELAKLKVER